MWQVTEHRVHGSLIKIWRSLAQGQDRRCKNGPKSVFPQCKTSISSNSASVKHRAMKFPCSMVFLVMADRMLWLPSLSRDQQWPLVTKCTHSRVVGLTLEGNLVSWVAVAFSFEWWRQLASLQHHGVNNVTHDCVHCFCGVIKLYSAKNTVVYFISLSHC